MSYEEAKQLVIEKGFKIIKLIEENDGIFIFLCNGDDDSEIEVSVVNGEVFVAPT